MKALPALKTLPVLILLSNTLSIKENSLQTILMLRGSMRSTLEIVSMIFFIDMDLLRWRSTSRTLIGPMAAKVVTGSICAYKLWYWTKKAIQERTIRAFLAPQSKPRIQTVTDYHFCAEAYHLQWSIGNLQFVRIHGFKIIRYLLFIIHYRFIYHNSYVSDGRRQWINNLHQLS